MKTLRTAGVIDHRKDGMCCFVSLRREMDRIFPGLLQSILESRRDPGGAHERRLPVRKTT